MRGVLLLPFLAAPVASLASPPDTNLEPVVVTALAPPLTLQNRSAVPFDCRPDDPAAIGRHHPGRITRSARRAVAQRRGDQRARRIRSGYVRQSLHPRLRCGDHEKRNAQCHFAEHLLPASDRHLAHRSPQGSGSDHRRPVGRLWRASQCGHQGTPAAKDSRSHDCNWATMGASRLAWISVAP